MTLTPLPSLEGNAISRWFVKDAQCIAEASAHLQSLLDIVFQWSQQNSLALNIKKCNVTYVPACRKGKSTAAMPAIINDQALTAVDNVRILIVTTRISNDLLWVEHAKCAKTKLSGKLGLFWRLDHIINMKCRL